MCSYTVIFIGIIVAFARSQPINPILLDGSDPWCDNMRETYGCKEYIGSALLGIASDDTEVIPLQVITNATLTTENTGHERSVAEFASMRAPTLHIGFFTDTHDAALRLDEKSGELSFHSYNGTVAFWEGPTKFSFDAKSGCLLVNGSVPPNSPCKDTGATFADTVTAWFHSSSVSVAVAVIVIGCMTLIIGMLIGCCVGITAEKRRAAKQAFQRINDQYEEDLNDLKL